MKTIYFDVDGVLRNLAGEVVKKYWNGVVYTDWNKKLNGMDLTTLVNQDLSILDQCKPTEYYKIIKKYYPTPTLWSHQPSKWVEQTTNWLSCHFRDFKLVNMNPEQKYRVLQDKKEKCWLIEDYPFYKSYERIVLIDRPYNQETKAYIRIKTPKQLEEFILEEEYNGRKER